MLLNKYCATAVAVASALRYGVDHLFKGAVDPTDGCSDSDEDVLPTGTGSGSIWQWRCTTT